MIGRGGQYVLGTGDYKPRIVAGKLIDTPWTERLGIKGSDCAGFALCWCYKLRRHRPGYASGRVPREYWDQSDVDDDINCNSAIEDALTTRELFEIVDRGPPLAGDLLVYPSLRLTLNDGSVFRNIGHVGIVVSTARVGADWTWLEPDYHLLDVAQCKGPNGRAPAVVLTDGSVWDRHDQIWPKKAHRTLVLRARL